jgi:hypothetical protein
MFIATPSLHRMFFHLSSSDGSVFTGNELDFRGGARGYAAVTAHDDSLPRQPEPAYMIR